MNCNPDPTKLAHEAIFSRKVKKEDHPLLVFNNNSLSEANSQKHLGIVLDNRSSFEEHFKMTLNKVNKTKEILRKFYNILPRFARRTTSDSISITAKLFTTKFIMQLFMRNQTDRI